jgi:hypothetical protein
MSNLPSLPHRSSDAASKNYVDSAAGGLNFLREKPDNPQPGDAYIDKSDMTMWVYVPSDATVLDEIVAAVDGRKLPPYGWCKITNASL